MQDPILSDFLGQQLNSALAAIRQKDRNTIITTINVLSTQIANAQAVLDDPYLSQIEEIALTQTNRIELLDNFRKLFDLYSTYLEQTNGVESYNSWETKTNSKYNNKTPKDYLNGLQPNWYTTRDTNGDGQTDEVIPEFNAFGQRLNWTNSPTPSGVLYRTTRGAFSSSGLVSSVTSQPTSGLTNAPTTNLANVGGCMDPKYSYRIRQSTDPLLPSTKRFYGFSIKQPPRLLVTFFAACPGTPPTELFTITVNSNTFWTFTQNSEGNLTIQPKDSERKSLGKIKYGYYYELGNAILAQIYDKLRTIRINNPITETAYQNIQRQLSEGKLFFVNNFDINMGESSGLPRSETFFKPGTPNTGFVTSLPDEMFVDNNIPKTDITSFNQMNVVENFFFMGTTEYKNLVYNDAKLSTNLTSTWQNNDITVLKKTTFIDSRITEEVENRGSIPNQPTTMDTAEPIRPVVGGQPLGRDECGEESDFPYYGKVSWKFKIDPNNDCSSPCLTSGFAWNLVADNSDIRDYEYEDSIRKYIKETTGGEVTGDIVGVLRGGRGTAEFENLLRNGGLVPMKNSPSNTVTTIPGQPCLKGIKTDYQWGVTRRKKVPFKIYCNKPGVGRVLIDYRNDENIKNWVISQLAGPNSGASRELNGKLKTTIDGWFYTTENEVVPIIPNFSGEPGVYFSSFSGISLNRENIACVPKNLVESTWRIDLDNPCGCDEVEILTHYLIYEEIKYTDPLYGTTETFPLQKILDPAYPSPLPDSKAASYGLTIGQELTDNRRQKVDCFERTGEGRLHHPFLYGTDVLPGIRKKSIKGLFNLSQSLECYHTSSEQSTSAKEYYYDVTDCDNCGRTSYFAVAYGNYNGSGSLSSGYERNDSPSRAIYSQYRLLALDPHEKQFSFYDFGQLKTTDDIYVINYYRNGLSDKLDIGNFEINIAELSGSGIVNSEHTGSKVQVSGSNPKILTFIDNSAIYDSMDVCSHDDPLYYYDIVSGSLTNGIHDSGTGSLQTNSKITTYGKVYPNLGVIVLDGQKLNASASFNSVTGSNINGDNGYKLFTAISGAAVVGKPMRARNVKFKTTNHYFVRVPSGEANYSNNPTWVFDSGQNRGKIKNACFVDNPITYITTVGLYNSKSELLAVAKLSKPIKKSKENDVLIKVRLNW